MKRLFYIDNLRFFLISLVVLQHFNITYGGPGDWYYNESEAGFPEIIPQAMFNITNQSFFMGMFFMISAFFTVASLSRKTTGRFIKERLIRLGIPLVVYYFILNPLTNFINWRYIRHEEVTLLGFITNPRAQGFGPMWFVEALLILTFIYLLVRPLRFNIPIKFPSTLTILIVAVFTGILQFIIRIRMPAGWSQSFTNFQFPFFLQYILLFIAGIKAYQNNWLESITFRMAKRWFIFAQAMIWTVLPTMLYFGGKEYGIESFVGRGTWQSFSWAVWEQVTGFAMIIGLLGLGKKFADLQGSIARHLSDSAYGVYVFHPPVILGISALFLNFHINQLLKFIVLAPVALVSCFIVAWTLRKIPGINRII